MEEMDVIGVSKYCGLTKRTIYNMVSTGRIPYRRLSEKRVSFNKRGNRHLAEKASGSQATENSTFKTPP